MLVGIFSYAKMIINKQKNDWLKWCKLRSFGDAYGFGRKFSIVNLWKITAAASFDFWSFKEALTLNNVTDIITYTHLRIVIGKCSFDTEKGDTCNEHRGWDYLRNHLLGKSPPAGNSFLQKLLIATVKRVETIQTNFTVCRFIENVTAECRLSIESCIRTAQVYKRLL